MTPECAVDFPFARVHQFIEIVLQEVVRKARRRLPRRAAGKPHLDVSALGGCLGGGSSRRLLFCHEVLPPLVSRTYFDYIQFLQIAIPTALYAVNQPAVTLRKKRGRSVAR